MGTARIRLQIDIGIGDVITPAPIVKALPAILPDFAPPSVKVYPPETIVAEKLHALVKLGIANSRMKDYADRSKQMQWRAFLKKSGVPAPEEFPVVGELLRAFLLPIFRSITSGKDGTRRWQRGGWRS